MDLSAMPGVARGHDTTGSAEAIVAQRAQQITTSRRGFLSACALAAVEGRRLFAQELAAEPGTAQKSEESSELTRLLDRINAGSLKESFKEALSADINELKKLNSFDQLFFIHELDRILKLPSEDPTLATEINLLRFVRKNIIDLRPLSPPLPLAQDLAEEKLNTIRKVWKAVNKAVTDGLIPANSLGIANYTNLETSGFLEELKAASEKPGWKPLPDGLMRRLLKIDSINIAAALISLFQQELLSPKELIKIAQDLEMKTFHIQSCRPWKGELDTLQLTILEEILRDIAKRDSITLQEKPRGFVENDDAVIYYDRVTDEERLKTIGLFCDALRVDVAQLIKKTKMGESYASIISPNTMTVVQNSVDEAATTSQTAETIPATAVTPTGTSTGDK